jgi:RNA polymerase sigma-70 factor (ECF subfamily)
LTEEQFKYIYSQYGHAIREYIYYRSGDTSISDDITQETFIKVWEKQFIYDAKKTKSLLYKIANGLFIDHIRKNKIVSEYIQQLKFNLKNDVDASEENEILLQKCEKALANLSEKERVVFLMNRKDELKYREIAERLNISVKAVEKRMSQALKKLKVK